MKGSQIIQKLKPGQKAKSFASALPHVGAGIIFTSAIAVVAMQIASHFNEKAGEMVSKLGSEKLFYFTVAVGALTAIAGIAYLASYLQEKKENKELQQYNQRLIQSNQSLGGYNRTLKAGINFVANADENSTDLEQVKADQAFAAAQRAAQA